ncbi:MAG TPA: glycine cleavage system protein H, partial [bacterium]
GWNLVVDSKSINMLSPVNGEVIEINKDILNSPEVVNQDPYGKGWLIKVKVPKINTDTKNLLSGKLARKWMDETVNTLRERIGGTLGLVSQDGGLPVNGIARALHPEEWDRIASEFFMIS